MSMTAVIESIERDEFRQVTSKNIGNIENVKIECTTLGEDPIVVADTKEDEEALLRI